MEALKDPNLTNDQKKGILTAEIEKLFKQKETLDKDVKKLAEQYNDYVIKRNRAIEEFELSKKDIELLENKAKEKLKLAEEKLADAVNQEGKHRDKLAKLSDEREQFKRDYAVFRENEAILKTQTAELQRKFKAFLEREKALELREEELSLAELGKK